MLLIQDKWPFIQRKLSPQIADHEKEKDVKLEFVHSNEFSK